MTKSKPGKPDWTIRRRWIARIVVFNMLAIVACLIDRVPEAIALAALPLAFGSITLCLGFYVAGATTEDVMAAKG